MKFVTVLGLARFHRLGDRNDGGRRCERIVLGKAAVELALQFCPKQMRRILLVRHQRRAVQARGRAELVGELTGDPQDETSSQAEADAAFGAGLGGSVLLEEFEQTTGIGNGFGIGQLFERRENTLLGRLIKFDQRDHLAARIVYLIEDRALTIV